MRRGRGRTAILRPGSLRDGEDAHGEPAPCTSSILRTMSLAPHAPTAPSAFSATVAPPEDALHRVRQLATDETTTLADGGPLHAAVAEVARRARASGCPPERTLVALKLCAPPHAGFAPPERARWLRTAIVRWAIEAYFETR